MTHDQENTRPPAPELSPNELLTAIEFEHLPAAFPKENTP